MTRTDGRKEIFFNYLPSAESGVGEVTGWPVLS